MHGRSGHARPKTSRVATMSARQRRSELAAIIASGIANAVASRAESDEQAQDSAVDGLALSAGSRLSVPLAEPPDRNGPKAGEHA